MKAGPSLIGEVPGVGQISVVCTTPADGLFCHELCGLDSCGNEPALPAFSTDAAPEKCVCGVSFLNNAHVFRYDFVISD